MWPYQTQLQNTTQIQGDYETVCGHQIWVCRSWDLTLSKDLIVILGRTRLNSNAQLRVRVRVYSHTLLQRLYMLNGTYPQRVIADRFSSFTSYRVVGRSIYVRIASSGFSGYVRSTILEYLLQRF